MSQGWFPLGAPEENLFPGLFQLLESPASLGSWPPPPASKSTMLHLSDPASVITRLSLTLSSALSPTFKDPVVKLGPPVESRMISPFEGLLISTLTSICNFNSPLPCEVIDFTGSRD